MEIEYWWLLALPLFFGLGWLAARVDIRQVIRESRALPRTWLRGLNHLLNGEPDRAVDAFSEAARIDRDNVELHFALGSLLRRQGDTERAIRVHQTLLERDDLKEDRRLEALDALGEDYLHAGLLDRAEEVFVRLRGTRFDEHATRNLLEIYQQEKEWGKAVEVAQTLSNHESVQWRTEVANFHCEMATVALADSRHEDARQHIDEAFALNRRCVRANILLGDLHLAEGRPEDAIAAWKRVENQDPMYLSLVAERLMGAYEQAGRVEQGQTLLRAWLAQHPSLDLLEEVFRWEIAHNGPRSAYELVREQLRRHPTLLGLEKLLEAALHNAPPEQLADVELVKQLIHSHTRRVARYRCSACGFKARHFQWRCAACGGWETYPPRRTEEFDLDP